MNAALARIDGATPLDRLRSLRAAVPGRIVFTTSFGLEDQALTHLIATGRLAIEIATLDTGRLFPSTYKLWQETEERYGLRIRSVHPDGAALAALQFIAAWLGQRPGGETLALVVRPAAVVQALLCGLAFLMLLWVFARTDLSVLLVAEDSRSDPPMIYKVAGAWGNHEGSMLLWITIMALAGGLILVALFLLIFYRFLGLVAVFGLAVYAVLLYAAILLFDVLHMLSAAEQESLLASMAGTLEAGGVMLIREADAAAGWRFTAVRCGNRLKALVYGAWEQSFHFRTAAEWRACLVRHGFDAEVRDMSTGTPFANVLLVATRRAS